MQRYGDIGKDAVRCGDIGRDAERCGDIRSDVAHDIGSNAVTLHIRSDVASLTGIRNSIFLV